MKDYNLLQEELQEKTKNLIPLIAKELGVEIGEEFYIDGWTSYKHRFTNNQIEIYLKDWTEIDNETYRYIFTNNIKIKKLPQKPKLTKDEKVILRNVEYKFKWIARDKDNNICVYREKPSKQDVFGCWSDSNRIESLTIYNHLFQFIKWENEEPYNIEELLGY